MKNLHMYLCDVCGYSREKPAMCPRCSIPLTEYTKETQSDFQVYQKIQEAMRGISDYQWYL